MIIKTLKVRILRALKSLPAAASNSSPPSPTKPGGGTLGVMSIHADAFSDDGASFFDAREAETPTSTQRLLAAEAEEAEPLDAWELVDDPEGRASGPPAAAAEEREREPEPDPRLLEEFPAPCPPGPGGGERGVVLYTTTLRGVRRTFEDCNGVRALLECLGVAFQERDVSMDRGLRDELWALTGDKAVPPRLFARGRDLGGAAQVLALHEEGRLVSLLLPPSSPSPSPSPRPDDKTKQLHHHRPHPNHEEGRIRKKCEACGGLRFVVCGECDGSRKVFDGGRRAAAARCRRCNENGLVACPLCCL